MSALGRRWYLLLMVVAVTAGGALGVVRMIGPTYETQGAVLVLPPGSTGSGSTETVGNPYLSLSGVSQVRDVVIRTMTSKTFLDSLCAGSGGPEYEAMTAQMCRQSPPGITFQVTPDFTSGAPMILVTVSSESPDTGGVALRAITDRVPGILRDLQADLGLRPKALVSSTPVVMDYKPDVVHKKQIRAGLVAGAGIFALGLLVVALIDSALQRRKTVGAPDRPAEAEHEPEPTDAGWGWDEDDATGSAPTTSDAGAPTIDDEAKERSELDVRAGSAW